MRTTVIPAQITTVEDKIAGNFNLTQILLLMTSVFWATFVYAFFPPAMHIVWYKLTVVVIVSFFSIILSFRMKGKVILNWVVIILRYNIRPRYYIFNKNDLTHRVIDLRDIDRASKEIIKKIQRKQIKQASIPLHKLMKLEDLLINPKYTFSFKLAKKGGINVAFEQIQSKS